MQGAILAVIPARAGSKRLPRKNTLLLGEYPLITWTIKAAQAVERISHVLVSTDSPEIAAIASSFGAHAPFLRAAELASDHATSVAVTLDAVSRAEEHFGLSYETVLLLQPTSPFRRSSHIDEALDLMAQRAAKAVISVCPCEHPPQWCNSLPPDQALSNFLRPEVKGKRSQDFPLQYRINGAIYAIDVAALRRHESFMLDHEIFAYPMEIRDSVDIDEQLDYEFACFLAQQSESP